MPILQSPCGQPVFCVAGRVNDLLAQGYRVQREVEGREMVPDHSLAIATTLNGVVDLNSASLKDMSELPGVGTATAKKIREGRPYRFLEDLIEQLPDVPWLSLRDRITLNKPLEIQQKPEDQDGTDA